jgi:putative ABC transport system permease protein
LVKNYLLVAWRHILKNKLYSTINILGLVVGLTVFLFGTLLVSYEQNHDTFFKNSNRIFTVGSVFSPTADIGINLIDSVNSAVAPLIKAEIPEVELVARTIRKEMLISIGDDDYYQVLRFADADLLRIFDFTYLEGNQAALDVHSGLVMTRTAALKYFGEGPVLGKSIELDHDKVLNVTAVIDDLPDNSHFNSALVIPAPFELIAHISVLNTERDNAEEGNWDNLSLGDLTYLLVPEKTSLAWIQTRMDGIYARHFPEEDNDIVSAFKVHRLRDANTFLWSAIGMPVIETVQLLAILVLIVAIVNYTNLATAQSLGRTHEVGLRKTMGAGRSQLLVQFLMESLLIATIAMIISVPALEIAVRIFNTSLGKGISIDYVNTLPWLLLVTIMVGLTAGAYPAHLITRTNPIDALRHTSPAAAGGSVVRSLMSGVQFAISIFMLAIVLVVYFQNDKLQKSADIYPRAQIVSLQRLSVPGIRSRFDVLKNEISTVRGVTGFSYSSQIPFQQNNSPLRVTPLKGDDTHLFTPLQVSVDPGFFGVYDIPILKGRSLGVEIANDTLREDVYSVNVVVNEMMLEKLGYNMDTESPVFYDYSTTEPPRTYSVVGIIPDQNFRGFHNQVNAMVFLLSPQDWGLASLRIQGRVFQPTLTDIRKIWDEIVPEYPVQLKFLDETFNDVFKIYSAMTRTLTGFAFLAMTLSLVGLFGLAAFMVEQKTREIGIRKVMGANRFQIVKLLVWQFSRPVIWSSLIALPAAYFASNTYLDFFSDRLPIPGAFIAIAGAMAILLSWTIVAIHAMRIARTSPIHALRYE